jgi:Na+-transporting NADH:ubiquinone oxidoreductase subunit NqrC
MSQEIKSKAEVAYGLYSQAEQQLIVSVEKADKAVIEAQQKLQQAQSDRIAVQAQLALIKKVNERVEEYTVSKDASSTDTP